MERKIILQNQEIKYTYRKLRRAKRLTITVKRDASVLVTSPHYLSIKFAEKTLLKQSDWIIKKINQFKTSPSLFFETNKTGEYQQYKERARVLIHGKIDKLNQIYNFNFKRVTIRRQTTMWGSCSSKGNLNFNYKLYFLPDYLAEYVVAHELCHLQELNHSKDFWDLVAQTIPEYQARVKQLKVQY